MRGWPKRDGTAGRQCDLWYKTSVSDVPDTFEITFAPDLTPEQVGRCLTILADYYRACGGAGLETDFDVAEVLVEEPVNVLT